MAGDGMGAASTTPRATEDWRQRAASIGARYGVLIALAVLVVIFSALRPETFPTFDTFRAILAQWAPVAILAFGVTVVLIMEDFDLSVVGMITLTSGLSVTMMTVGVPFPLALLVTLAVAIGLGMLNGYLVAGVGVSSFIVTLAAGEIYRGVDLQITEGRTIFSGIPEAYLEIGGGSAFGLSNSVWIALVVFVVLYVLLEHTQTGRSMYAVGGNRDAARLSGVPVARLRTAGFVITAVAAVIAAVVLTGQAAAYSSEIAGSYLLPPYAAVFLGAAVFRPGTVNLTGTLVGALFLEVINTGLTTLSLGTSIILIVQGLILTLAVVLSVVLQRRRKRR